MATAAKKTAASTAKPEVEKASRADLLKQAYQAANKRLRAAHNEEFQNFYKEEAAALGEEYKPKPTAEEKAAAEVAALLEKFPHLREQVVGASEGDGDEDSPI